jgi:TRAP-type C4-dicarboxylate transport system permease small subunit
MAFFSRLSRWINWFLIVIGAVAMLSMMAIVVGNSLGRAIFKMPIFGTIEDAGMAGAILVAVAIGFAERERINIIIRALFDHFPGRVQFILECFTLFLSLGAVGYLFWSTLEKSLESLAKAELTIVTQVPVAPFRFFWAFGVLILCLFLAQHLVERIAKGEKK